MTTISPEVLSGLRERLRRIDQFQTTRLVTMEECPWLDDDVERGTVVYRYSGVTYGCIGPDGLAVTLEPDTTPFFELPLTALQENTK